MKISWVESNRGLFKFGSLIISKSMMRLNWGKRMKINWVESNRGLFKFGSLIISNKFTSLAYLTFEPNSNELLTVRIWHGELPVEPITDSSTLPLGHLLMVTIIYINRHLKE